MELSDRAALGEALSNDDTRFAREHARTCTTCAAEAEVYGVLAGCLAPEGARDEHSRTQTQGPFDLRDFERAPARTTTTTRLRWGVAALGAAALAAAALLTVRSAPTAAPPAPPIDTGVNLVLSAGQVESHGARVTAGSELAPGGDLRVAQGRACLSFAGTTTACAAENTSLSLTTSDQERRVLDLQRGAVVCRQDSPPPGVRFSVQTPRGKVTALGTVFTVELLPSSEVAVRVHRGVVEVEPTRGGRHELHAPAAAILGDDVRRVPTQDDAWDGDRELVEVAQLWSDRTAAPLELATAPAGARVSLDGFSLGSSPLSALVGRGPHELRVEHAGFEPHRERFVVQGSERVALTPELRPTAPAPVVAPPNAPGEHATPLAAADLLARARTLRKSGRYAEAANTYQLLRKTWPRSAEAPAALLSLADLELTRLGKAEAALRSFDTYLAAGGPLAQEARYDRIRALRQLGREADARRATAEFLRDYPGSLQAQTLRSQPVTTTEAPPRPHR
jgi:hypothetical protein